MARKPKIVVTYIAWWIIWFVLQAITIYLAGYDWQISIVDSGITNLILALEGYAVTIMLSVYRPDQKNSMYLFAWSAALAGLCTGIMELILGQLFASNEAYLLFLDNSVILRFAFSFLMIAFLSVLGWLWFYLQAQKEAEARQAAVEKISREAELYSLRQQLQPHFLFNSLNSINALISAEPDKARTMVQQLSDFFRGTLKKADSQQVTLEEELKQLQLYLDIEKVRFGHRLKVVVEKEDLVDQMKLPSLLLQPVVENAIKFGLYDVRGEVVLKVTASRESRMLVLCVENPFDPETALPKKGTGFGLSSIERRLYLVYARNDLLTTERIDTTFRTCIKIPQTA